MGIPAKGKDGENRKVRWNRDWRRPARTNSPVSEIFGGICESEVYIIQTAVP
jgi:hypothetical protein